MPNEYEFDAVRWLRNNAQLAANYENNAMALSLTACADEIQRLRTENDTLRNESRVYRAQCAMRDEWRDKIEAELAALKDEIAQRQDTEASLTKWVHDLGEELDALKEAARPVVKWWRKTAPPYTFTSWVVRHTCPETGMKTVVTAAQLDALAALVGEE